MFYLWQMISSAIVKLTLFKCVVCIRIEQKRKRNQRKSVKQIDPVKNSLKLSLHHLIIKQLISSAYQIQSSISIGKG